MKLAGKRPRALLLQFHDSDAAAATLDEWTTPARGSREGEYAKVRKRAEKWADGGKDAGLDDLYAESQVRLKEQGIDSVKAFRGLTLPQDHPLAKAIRSGAMKKGDSFSAEGMKVSSWSENADVAASFGDNFDERAARLVRGSKSIGVVIERTLDRSDIVASHRTHTGFLEGEEEVIALNEGKSKVRIRAIYGV